jgi:hypothetical protein
MGMSQRNVITWDYLASYKSMEILSLGMSIISKLELDSEMSSLH